jgi:S1-C subfamily serine protease
MSTSTVSGSGFIISEDGYILTNAHVVEGASNVSVTTIDGATYEAELIGYDSDYEVGVLKIDPAGGSDLRGHRQHRRRTGGRTGMRDWKPPWRVDLFHYLRYCERT